MTDKEFSLRLAKLRTQKGVSARDMSLSMGQNPGYINNIETRKSMPSLTKRGQKQNHPRKDHSVMSLAISG